MTCVFNTQSLVSFCFLIFAPHYLLHLPLPSLPWTISGGPGDSSVKASFGVWFCHSLAMGLWGKPLKPLMGLSFLTCEMRMIMQCCAWHVGSRMPRREHLLRDAWHLTDMNGGQGGQEMQGNWTRQGHGPFLLRASISTICNFLKSLWFGDFYFLVIFSIFGHDLEQWFLER